MINIKFNSIKNPKLLSWEITNKNKKGTICRDELDSKKLIKFGKNISDQTFYKLLSILHLPFISDFTNNYFQNKAISVIKQYSHENEKALNIMYQANLHNPLCQGTQVYFKKDHDSYFNKEDKNYLQIERLKSYCDLKIICYDLFGNNLPEQIFSQFPNQFLNPSDISVDQSLNFKKLEQQENKIPLSYFNLIFNLYTIKKNNKLNTNHMQIAIDSLIYNSGLTIEDLRNKSYIDLKKLIIKQLQKLEIEGFIKKEKLKQQQLQNTQRPENTRVQDKVMLKTIKDAEMYPITPEIQHYTNEYIAVFKQITPFQKEIICSIPKNFLEYLKKDNYLLAYDINSLFGLIEAIQKEQIRQENKKEPRKKLSNKQACTMLKKYITKRSQDLDQCKSLRQDLHDRSKLKYTLSKSIQITQNFLNINKPSIVEPPPINKQTFDKLKKEMIECVPTEHIYSLDIFLTNYAKKHNLQNIIAKDGTVKLPDVFIKMWSGDYNKRDRLTTILHLISERENLQKSADKQNAKYNLQKSNISKQKSTNIPKITCPPSLNKIYKYIVAHLDDSTFWEKLKKQDYRSNNILKPEQGIKALIEHIKQDPLSIPQELFPTIISILDKFIGENKESKSQIIKLYNSADEYLKNYLDKNPELKEIIKKTICIKMDTLLQFLVNYNITRLGLTLEGNSTLEEISNYFAEFKLPKNQDFNIKDFKTTKDLNLEIQKENLKQAQSKDQINGSIIGSVNVKMGNILSMLLFELNKIRNPQDSTITKERQVKNTLPKTSEALSSNKNEDTPKLDKSNTLESPKANSSEKIASAMEYSQNKKNIIRWINTILSFVNNNRINFALFYLDNYFTIKVINWYVRKVLKAKIPENHTKKNELLKAIDDLDLKPIIQLVKTIANAVYPVINNNHKCGKDIRNVCNLLNKTLNGSQNNKLTDVALTKNITDLLSKICTEMHEHRYLYIEIINEMIKQFDALMQKY